MTNRELIEQVAELQRRVDAMEDRRVLEAERIEIVEPDGATRLVISNSARGRRHSPGLIFHDDEGDECGGLIFGGQRTDEGHAAGAALMFDQFKQDQVVGISHGDSPGRRWAGLSVWDRPDEPFPAVGGAMRLFAGKTVEESAVVELRDAEGRVRVSLSVASDGTAGLEFLDADGEVTARLPD